MKNHNKLTRRRFIGDTSKAAVAISAAGMIGSCNMFSGKGKYKIPRRRFGKTGLDVSILSFGGGTQFLRNNDGEWEKVLEAAIEGGINFFDTAPSYCASKFYQIGDGKSVDSCEERFGKILPAYRDKIILSTKLETRDPEEAKHEMEGSLKRMNTDYLDVLLIHGINESDNIAKIEKGLFKTMLEFKESGAVKHIGVSSMQHAGHAAEMIEKLDFDVALLTLNATKYGEFADQVLPVTRKKDMGIFAMKVMRDIVGKEATPKELLDYVWSLEGVASATIGHYGLDTLAENLQLSKDFDPEQLANYDLRNIENRLAYLAGPHTLCYAKPGYRDGDAVVVNSDKYWA